MRLPGEEELQEEVRRECVFELQAAKDLLDIGLSIFSPQVKAQPPEAMESIELWILLGMIARACRQFRAIVVLAEISLADIADTNCRMLLESVLGMEFMTRRDVVLKQEGKPLPAVVGFPLTRAFRTQLYLAHEGASGFKNLEGMASCYDGDKNEAARVLQLLAQNKVEGHAEIGAEWAKRQKRSQNFFGVRVQELADSLDLISLYHVFYRPSSSGVHGTNITRYVDVEERPDGGFTFSAKHSSDGVGKVITLAVTLMIQLLQAANQRAGFKLDEQLGEVALRLPKMIRE